VEELARVARGWRFTVHTRKAISRLRAEKGRATRRETSSFLPLNDVPVYLLDDPLRMNEAEGRESERERGRINDNASCRVEKHPISRERKRSTRSRRCFDEAGIF